jgi:NADH dehydrogenase [ubiquinone] 1 alpha subcomplex assembly factor 7
MRTATTTTLRRMRRATFHGRVPPQSCRLFATKRQGRMAAAASRDDDDSNETMLINTDGRHLTNDNQQRFILPKALLPMDPTNPRSLPSSSNLDDTSLFSMQQAKELYNPDIHLPSAPTSWEGYEASTPLTEELISWIGVTGRPLSTADFMRLALTHPQHGYYTQAVSKAPKDDFDEDEYNEDDSKDDATIIGPGGDFITAPEISQIFGECLGVWFYTQWQQQDWQWLECGPGKGSLTVDFLQFALKLSDTRFVRGCQALHLVEASPVLRGLQQQALQELQQKNSSLTFNFDVEKTASSNDGTPKSGDGDTHTIQVHWHDSWSAFQLWQQQQQDKLATFAVCQEFLDALPVHAFEKTEEGYWRERLVDVALREDIADEEEPSSGREVPDGSKKPRFRIVLAPEATPALKMLLGTDEEGFLRVPKNGTDEETTTNDSDSCSAPVGSVVEVSPESVLTVQDMSTMIQEQGGAALIIDYGQEGSADSIRGYAKHKQVLFLSHPGLIDVTADVDFAALRHAVNRSPQQRRRAVLAADNDNDDVNDDNKNDTVARAFGPVGQGDFLVAMGLQERVIQLMEREDVTDQVAEDLYDAMVRLASPEEMGQRYKVLGIVQTLKNGSSLPPGFG